MLSANNVKHTYTLNQGYPGQFPASQEFTTDTRTATTTIGWSVSALARVGYLVTDKTLVYFSGGLGTANVSSTFTHTAVATINGPPSTTVVTGSNSVSKTVTGYALGGGWNLPTCQASRSGCSTCARSFRTSPLLLPCRLHFAPEAVGVRGWRGDAAG